MTIIYSFFFSLIIQVPSLSQWPQQHSKEEEDKYPTTNSAQPNHYHRNPFQWFIIHHNIDPKSTSKQTKPSENPTQNQAKPTKEPTWNTQWKLVGSTAIVTTALPCYCHCIYLTTTTRSNSKSTKKKLNKKPILKTQINPNPKLVLSSLLP